MFLTGDEAVLALRKPGVAPGGAAATRGVGPSGAGPGPNAVRPYNRRNPFGAETRIHGAARQPSLFGPGTLPLPLLPMSLDADSLADIRVEMPQERSATALRMRLVGANGHAAAAGADELPGKVNYFIGNDPKKWRTNVPTYAKVKYQGVYPGIDLVYYGNQGGQLEYDFVVAPGADASVIALDVAAGLPRHADVGAGLVPAREGHPRGVPLRLAADGDLIIPTGDGEVRFHKPVAYQEAPSETGNAKFETRRSVNRQSTIVNRKLVDGRFTLDAENRVRFALGPYDHSEPLVIDPVLVYSTYLGGSGGDSGHAIAVDSFGNAYVAGITGSSDFPTVNPLQANFGGGVRRCLCRQAEPGRLRLGLFHLPGRQLPGLWLRYSRGFVRQRLCDRMDAIFGLPDREPAASELARTVRKRLCRQAERRRLRAGLFHLPRRQLPGLWLRYSRGFVGQRLRDRSHGFVGLPHPQPAATAFGASRVG
ncbi:MAG TPA: SBBP repeat-containing protein [Terriglobia bacterium]|nr:SBBP repeat-containing protein [Terriglobia bacterium]